MDTRRTHGQAHSGRLGRRLLAMLLCVALTPTTACARSDAPRSGGGVAGSTSSTTPTPGTAAALPVRNVIIVIGDGMGYNHIRAANLYTEGRPVAQSYERFPVRVAMATYSHPSAGGRYDPKAAWGTFDYVTEKATASAGAATAMSTGTKTRASVIGVGVDGRRLGHSLERAEVLGKATGVVTSVPMSHATPAGFVAHNSDRHAYTAIANEMLRASAVDVVMGAGHPDWTDSGTLRPPAEADYEYVGGRATWDALVAGSLGGDADRDGDPDPFTLVTTPQEFAALATGTTPPRVAGIAQCANTLQQGRRGARDADPFEVQANPAVPSLAVMAEGALNVLDDDPQGLFLVVESGAIDWAAAENQKGRLIEEQEALNDAVEAVVAWVERESSWDETLLVVTGDHETGYLWGPLSGQRAGGPVWNPLINEGRGTMPQMAFYSRDHTNSLIPLFAKGVGADRIRARVAGVDPKRGPYVDNTAIGLTLKAQMK